MVKVLCIDDEVDIRRDIVEVVSEAGYEVLEAGNGEDGLESILKNHPDLVLCDINMPGMSGRELLLELHLKHSECLEIPFIFLSADGARDDVLSGLGLGADDYLTKPIDHELLLLKLMSALRIPGEYQNRLDRLCVVDDVTRLPNRAKALESLLHSMSRMHDTDDKITVMSLTIEGFKEAVETVGRVGGDKLLQDVAIRLQSCAESGELVANLGGEDFLFLFSDHDLYSESVVQRIQDEFSSPCIIEGREIRANLKIGLASFPGNGDDPYTLVQNADRALLQARKLGVDYQYFTSEMNERVARRVEIEDCLHTALHRDEFSVHFQPLLNLSSQQLIGAEALLRWNSPELGSIGPDEFIPIAEDSGLIAEIGQWVLEEACRHAREWQTLYGQPYRIAVNVSAKELMAGNMVRTVSNVLQETGLAPDCLELEMTEGILIQDGHGVRQTLNTFKEMGIRLSIDDFGTGYSALSYLKKFPFDTLKIDRSFISEVMTDASNATLCTAIIEMAHGLGLEVIGEGVEDADQMEFLSKKGCDFVQGYFVEKPLPVQDFISILEKYNSYAGGGKNANL